MQGFISSVPQTPKGGFEYIIVLMSPLCFLEVCFYPKK